MKILSFSDLHNDRKSASRLVELADGVDVVIGAGDFCNCQRGIEKTISILRDIRQPSLLVPGNSETDTLLTDAVEKWSSAKVLHGNGCEIDGVRFYGIGGGIPVTPFGSWSFDFSEEQAEQLLSNASNVDVLISHSPPFGLLDQSSRGDHLGSQTVLNFISSQQVKLTICGHIHGSWNRIENTDFGTVINAGPHGIIYEL